MIRPKEWSQRMFRGMSWRDQPYTELEPGFVSYAYNMFPEDPINGSLYTRRVGAGINTTGSIGPGEIQGAWTMENADGTLTSFCAISGNLWKFTQSGTDGSWAKVVTLADFGTAGASVTTTGRWYGCQFGTKFVLHTGSSLPFMWDGTSGAASISVITNGPASAYGVPTVYFGKLFFIKGSDRRSIVWSEENLPNLGYEATVGGTTYVNVWVLMQTSQAPLVAIRGTNDGLYYFRRHSIGVIRGAVTTDFSSAGVHDAVSTAVGTTAPESVLLTANALWFTDEQSRPYRVVPGGGEPEPIWRDFGLNFMQNYAGSTFDRTTSFTAPMPYYNAVIFFLDNGSPNKWGVAYMYSEVTGRGMGEWPFGGSATMAVTTMVTNNYGRGMMVLTSNGSTLTTLLYPTNTAFSNFWTDQSGATAGWVTCAPIGGSPEDARWHFDEIWADVILGPVASPSQQVTLFVGGLGATGSLPIDHLSNETLAPTASVVCRSRAGLNRESTGLRWGVYFPTMTTGVVISVAGVGVRGRPVPFGVGVTV